MLLLLKQNKLKCFWQKENQIHISKNIFQGLWQQTGVELLKALLVSSFLKCLFYILAMTGYNTEFGWRKRIHILLVPNSNSYYNEYIIF